MYGNGAGDGEGSAGGHALPLSVGYADIFPPVGARSGIMISETGDRVRINRREFGVAPFLPPGERWLRVAETDRGEPASVRHSARTRMSALRVGRLREAPRCEDC